MNPLYEKSKDLVFIRRTSDNKEFEEYPVIVQPQSVLITDPANDVLCYPYCALHVGFAVSSSYSETSSYAYTASYAFNSATSSWAWFALSASFANSASYSLSSSNAISASYAYSASYALETSAALSSSHADYAESASWAFSASYAESASYGTNFHAPRVTASFVSASIAIQTNQLTASNALIRGRMFGTSSYAVDSFTSENSAYATTAGIATFAVSASTALYATNSISASHADSASYAVSASYEIIYETSSSYADFAQVASMSLGTRGLNVVNLAPMPNSEIAWTVLESTPAAFAATTTIGATGTASEGQTHTLVHLPDSNKIYGAGWYGSVYVLNDPDGDFNNVESCSLIAGNFASQMVYASGSLYVINGSNVSPSTGSITRININNITSQSVIVQGLPGATALLPLVTDGNFLLTHGNNNIYKWDLSGSLIQSTPCVSASVSVAASHGGCASTDGQWAFFSTTGGIITKVLISDVTNYTCSRREQNNFPNCCFNASITDDMCYLNGYIYTSVESGGNIIRMDADTLEFVAYPAAGNSYGVWTDGTHIYLGINSGEIWVYLNADLDSGPIRFGVPGVPNELAITNGGRFVYSQWTTLNINAYNLPITQLGINKLPDYALDVAGDIRGTNIYASNVSASTRVDTGDIHTVDATSYGTFTLDGTAIIRSNTSNALRITSGSVRVATLSSSADLVGRVFNTRFSQSISASATMSYTQSLGSISTAGEGMYRLTVAGTMGFYGGITLVTLPKWNFIHTDRFGAYTLPQTPVTPITLAAPAGYDYAFSFGGDYIFQAVAGSNVSYHYITEGSPVSSTNGSASFFTSVTLTQIMSGSVTGSI